MPLEYINPNFIKRQMKRMTNDEAMKKARNAKRNEFIIREFKADCLVVTAYEGYMKFDTGGPYDARLNEVDVGALRNFLTEWKNDKRYRDQRKTRRTSNIFADEGKRRNESDL